MLIDSSYFYGRRTVAQISEDSVSANVDAFIKEYEPKYLRCLFGHSFYSEFLTGLIPVAIPDTDPVEYEPIPEMWTKIRNGSTYVDKYGNTRTWIGLVNDELNSPIADYVYFYLLADTVTASTGTGEKTENAGNQKPASVIHKQVRAWNNMVDLTRELRMYLMSSIDTYPTWDDPLKPPVYGGCREIFHHINVLNF